MLNETYTLNNGVKIPKLGLGTWFISNKDARTVVKTAIAQGYRLIDTAQVYMNEGGVGQGVRESGIAREDIFVTDKIAAKAKSYEAAKKAIDTMLSTTGLDYLDLVIIHAPQPWLQWRNAKKRYFDENRAVWRAMEEAYESGKLRAIGVSNFLEDDLESLLSGCRIKPMVNQILCHISNTPQGLIDYCGRNDILVEAYSPIAHGRVLKNASLAEMAAKYNVGVPQLCIRYVIQLGAVALPKTANPDHMRTNAAVDFEISEADMHTLQHFAPIKTYGWYRLIPVFSKKTI